MAFKKFQDRFKADVSETAKRLRKEPKKKKEKGLKLGPALTRTPKPVNGSGKGLSKLIGL